MLRVNKLLLGLNFVWMALLIIVIWEKNNQVERAKEGGDRWMKSAQRSRKKEAGAFKIPQEIGLEFRSKETVSLWPAPGESAVLTIFFMPDCEFCDRAAKRWESWADYFSRLGIRTVGISTKSEGLNEFVLQHQLKFPIVIDAGKKCDEVGIDSFPSQVLTGPEGRVLAHDFLSKSYLGLDVDFENRWSASTAFVHAMSLGLYGESVEVEEMASATNHRIGWTISKGQQVLGFCSFGFDSAQKNIEGLAKSRALVFFNAALQPAAYCELNPFSLTQAKPGRLAADSMLEPSQLEKVAGTVHDAQLQWEKN